MKRAQASWIRRPLRVLISSGPTREPIDPVRFLSNYSTGYLGSCLATEAIRRGHRVTLVSGPATVMPPRAARVLWVEQTDQMQAALRRELSKADVLIMAAAVCDFRPVKRRPVKLLRHRTRHLALRATPDILGSLPRRLGQLRVGFALETGHAQKHALGKLKTKHLDLIVGQRLPAPRRSGQAGMNGTEGPFGNRAVNAFFLSPSGRATPLGTVSKTRLARAILDEIERLWYGVGVRKTQEL